MTRLRTELLQEGMAVAAEVRNMDNMVLLPTGATLTQRHIDILLAWGVPEVCVESTNATEELADPLTKVPPADLERLTAEVQAQFWSVDATSAVQNEIFKQVLRRKARRLAPPAP